MRSRSLVFLATAALSAGILGGCAFDLNTADSSEEALVQDLLDEGFAVEPQSIMQQPFFTENPGMVYLVDGEQIQVFSFVDEEAAEAAAATIEEDATQVGSIVITWQGAARFYQADELIALYVGTNEAILDALEDSLGDPIASTED